MGPTTTQDRPEARNIAPDHVAFRFDDSVGVPIAIFRSSIPSPTVPLFTLRHAPRDAWRKTQGRVVCYSFLVRLFHPLLHAGLSRRSVKYFRLYDLRSTYATRLSAGGVADEWVTQLLRQGDSKVFKKYSQMKLQMKREAQLKLNRHANEQSGGIGTVRPN